MNTLKQILNYLIWTSISIVLAFGYMRIILGPRDEEPTGFWKLTDILYDLALYHVGFVIGCIIATFFILIDIFYLKKKLKTNSNEVVIRFLILIIIALIVGVSHYVCEKVIDII